MDEHKWSGVPDPTAHQVAHLDARQDAHQGAHHQERTCARVAR